MRSSLPCSRPARSRSTNSAIWTTRPRRRPATSTTRGWPKWRRPRPSRRRLARFDQQAAQAPAEIEQTKAALASLPAQANAVFPADVTLPQIEQAISNAQADLDSWQRELANVETELKGRASRRADIPKDISRAQQVLSDVNGELQAPAPADESSPVGSARRLMLVAKRRAAEQEVLCCQKELAASEARADLLPVSRDLNAGRVALAEQEIKQWQEVVNRRRQQEAEQQARQAAWEAGQAIPAVKQLAQKNAALAEMRKSLAQHIADATRQLDQASQQLTALRDQFQRAREKVDTVGLTNAIGLLLRKQRDTLPNLAVYRRETTARQETIRDGQLALLQLQDDRAALANLDQQTQAVLQSLNGFVVPASAGRETTGRPAEAGTTNKPAEAGTTKRATGNRRPGGAGHRAGVSRRPDRRP